MYISAYVYICVFSDAESTERATLRIHMINEDMHVYVCLHVRIYEHDICIYMLMYIYLCPGTLKRPSDQLCGWTSTSMEQVFI